MSRYEKSTERSAAGRVGMSRKEDKITLIVVTVIEFGD